MRIFVQQRLCGEHYAAEAESTLGGTLVHERLLNRVRFFGSSQTFERRDLLLLDSADRRYAGADRPSVNDDGAGSALPESAAELRPT